jgi:hypothetical protein
MRMMHASIAFGRPDASRIVGCDFPRAQGATQTHSVHH